MEYIIISVALLLRCLVGLWGHSGEGVAPIYGDFEAQRHWLEVTSNLPVGDWYRDTADNDLQYWGLDYPPLTAYVSLALGKLAELMYPDMVALHASRGIETAACTFFMRSSVLLLDAAIFFPVVFKLGKAVAGTHVHPKYLFLSFLSPALVLIDHGHFQYNSTCLGLALLAAYLLDQDRYVLASVVFCCSLNFKQMALYYAPVFFFFLLGRCNDARVLVSRWRALGLLVQLGVAVVGSFALIWAPFCAYAAVDDGETCLSSLTHVLSRQFPFSRGIFEDKVANLWFALSVAYRHASGGADMREVSDTSTLAKASICLTLLLLAPTAAFLLRRGQRSARQLVTCLVTSALAFFLASFQVHEKSLLLAMVPAAVLIDKRDIPFGVWFQVLGLFTMLPLLVKDRLALPAAACTVVYLVVASLLYADVRPPKDRDEPTLVRIVQMVRTGFYRLSYVAMALILCAWALVPPPASLPDLYPVVVALFGVVNLCFAYLHFLYDLYVKYSHVPSPGSPRVGPVYASAKADPLDPPSVHPPLKSE